MANPRERDTVEGVASSASAEVYRSRRQGNLTRASDGFRAPQLPIEPRRPLTGGREVHPPVAPYHYNPPPPADGETFAVPRTFVFFRTATPGAPRVGFPDQERTQGKLQPSGAAWGTAGEPARAVLRPRVVRNGGFPALGAPNVEPVLSSGPRWTRPTAPKVL